MSRIRGFCGVLALSAAVCPGCAGERPNGPPSPDQLARTTYAGIYDEPVQLSQGSYEGEPFVPGGASRPTLRLLREFVATGELNGKPNEEAAVLLVENSGGSGSFLYLAAVGLQDGEPVQLGNALIGDRSQVQAISIEDARIRLELLEHGPQDPACCPSNPVTQNWVLRDGRLMQAAED